MQHLQPNTLLQGGRYRIIKTLGQGGFGITYLAIQIGLDRKVAVKEFFMKELCNRDEATNHVILGAEGSRETVNRFREKFLKEARLIASMDNNHIVCIHDIFEENGTAYYIMEYIDGGTLENIIKEQPLQETQALKYIHEIADALQYIHEHNILHLDVKPSNVLVRKNGEVVLIDFGISKRYDDQGGQTSTTPAGISKGYAPTEQYNQGIANFSPATDIYSLGATLYKMLTGVTPPEASLLLNEDEELVRPNGISFTTWHAIEESMEPRRKKRPQSISEFITLLGNIDVPKDIVKEKESGAEETTLLDYAVEAPMQEASTMDSIEDEDKTIIAERSLTELAKEEIQSVLPEEVEFCSKYGLKPKGKEAVDLGLSVLWCSCNLGSISPASSGSLKSWEKENITNCLDWRLPSTEEFKELKDKCNWKWIDDNGICGYLITSPTTGNLLFLRASGKKDGELILNPNIGFYWSDCLSSSAGNAYCTTFMPSTILCYNQNPYSLKMSMRLVCKKQ